MPRVTAANDRASDPSASYVTYWMTSYRRRSSNFALQRAVHWATELRKPLLVVEALNRDYPWASPRIKAAIVQGMEDNIKAFRGSAATYCPYVEPKHPKSRGLIHALAKESCVVVTDDFPAFEIPRWTEAVAARSPVLVEKVDSNGLFPMRAADRVFVTAYSFRRFLQKSLRPYLDDFPLPDCLRGVDLPKLVPPAALQEGWPVAAPRESFRGGPVAAQARLQSFLGEGIDVYAETRNQPESKGPSGLSPYLHFGHISTHEIFLAVAAKERWTAEKLGARADGSRVGWWGMRADAEAFLDQLVTWREIGFNMCALGENPFSYDSLPDWARKTLSEHAGDSRPVMYSPSQFESSETHDDLWNAAQRQLVTEGRIHNYLRMLWGKKILEWSPSPEVALETMIHLNNKYALDGRDPNSYSGIFWTLGRYDRPWAPVRPIFGSIRYLSSDNTARKLRVKDYLARYK